LRGAQRRSNLGGTARGTAWFGFAELCTKPLAAADYLAIGDGAFDFRRTVSRLIEMQSEDYIANRPRR
jgi:predicted ATPase